MKPSNILLASFLFIFLCLSCKEKSNPDISSLEQEILQMHNLSRKYHLEKMAEEFVSQLSDKHISVNKGKISHLNRNEKIKQVKQYFDLVEFEYPFYTISGDVSTDGDIVCSTCHNPHQWNPHRKIKGGGADIEGNATNSFLRLNLPSELCSYCHAKDGLIKFKYFHSQFSRTNK